MITKQTLLEQIEQKEVHIRKLNVEIRQSKQLIKILEKHELELRELGIKQADGGPEP